MATVVLQTVGAAIGGAIAGPVGAMIGRAAGAAAGYAIDQSLLSKDHVVTGPRLDGANMLSSNEGAAIPQIYGRNRVSGEIIWATRFEEKTRSSESGGKGGGPTSTTRSYTYSANFAVGICQGPISCLRRVWADGEELDLTKIEYRFYNGSMDQTSDPLIEAKQGAGSAPAYRGTAYIVFEGFELETFGNRIPQLSFEVVRAIGSLETKIKTMTVIPGSTEYGYDPEIVGAGGGDDKYEARNRHIKFAATDWSASIDELQALCPNLERVGLVISWFGNDLRASECNLLPGVTDPFHSKWQVSDFQRHTAHLVSQIDGKPAYGGTPDDASISRAISDLKARGLEVVIYPFIMMDVPHDNGLPALSGAGFQPAYPWRGEISCFPAIGEIDTVDQTAAARTQIEAFAVEYKRFIEHYVTLAQNAGGVDGFVIGSELRSLTRVRDHNNSFPFVETLMECASIAKATLGPSCLITYAADWSEYFGYQPQDGTGDVYFNLDSLWASENIDAVGIDNYMPLADWRNGHDPHDEAVHSIHDIRYLEANVEGGEGYDWYYASSNDRQNGSRTPITDGLGEPWVFRFKDVRSWWSNPHHDRIAGVRSSTPTEWVPGSKPIIFTELGCPAVDHGANQPNVFTDAKSSQSQLPYFSSGGRDDLIQRRFLEAHFNHWKKPENNPIDASSGSQLIGTDWIAPWAWDARPFPTFPQNENVWSDGENWNLGHWLTGRLGGCALDDLVRAILADFGYHNVEITLDGIVDGFISPGQATARETLEPLLTLFGAQIAEEQGVIKIFQPAYSDRLALTKQCLIQEEDLPKQVKRRVADIELPAEAVLTHTSVFREYEQSGSKSRHLHAGTSRQIQMQAPVVMPEPCAVLLAEDRLRDAWSMREHLNIALSSKDLSISVGDIITFEAPGSHKWLVEEIEIGVEQQLKLRSYSDRIHGLSIPTGARQQVDEPLDFGKPSVVFLDLPALVDADIDRAVLYCAVSAEPWARRYNIFSSPTVDGFQLRDDLTERAMVGRSLNSLAPGPAGRMDNAAKLTVSLTTGTLQSRTLTSLVAGANVLAVETSNGNYEVLQFRDAQLTADGTWSISGLLRGQLGTEAECAAGAIAGARVVVLDEALLSVALQDNEIGVTKNWRVGPSSEPISSPVYSALAHTPSGRTKQMLSPVHLKRVESEFSGLELRWIRRGRKDSDRWEPDDIPLDALQERYRITVQDLGGMATQVFDAVDPTFFYANSQMAADFGGMPASLRVSVAQLNNAGEAGPPAELIISQ